MALSKEKSLSIGLIVFSIVVIIVAFAILYKEPPGNVEDQDGLPNYALMFKLPTAKNKKLSVPFKLVAQSQKFKLLPITAENKDPNKIDKVTARNDLDVEMHFMMRYYAINKAFARSEIAMEKLYTEHTMGNEKKTQSGVYKHVEKSISRRNPDGTWTKPQDYQNAPLETVLNDNNFQMRDSFMFGRLGEVEDHKRKLPCMNFLDRVGLNNLFDIILRTNFPEKETLTDGETWEIKDMKIKIGNSKGRVANFNVKWTFLKQVGDIATLNFEAKGYLNYKTANTVIEQEKTIETELRGSVEFDIANGFYKKVQAEHSRKIKFETLNQNIRGPRVQRYLDEGKSVLTFGAPRNSYPTNLAPVSSGNNSGPLGPNQSSPFGSRGGTVPKVTLPKPSSVQPKNK